METRVVHLTTVPMTLMFLRGQAGYLRRRGFRTFVISSPGEELQSFAHSERVRAFGVRMSRCISPLPDCSALIRLWRVFRRLAPQIVHAHTPKAGVLGMCAAALAAVPVRVFHVHGLPQLTAGGVRRSLLNAVTWLTCRMATEVMAVSCSNAELLSDLGLCSPAKICVPAHGSINGVDAAERFSPARQDPSARARLRKQLGIPAQAFVALFAGRIAQDKGLADLIGAWDLVLREDADARLVIAGERDARDPVTPALDQRLRRHPAVRRIGWIEDMPELYAAADLVVLPSHREGFGMVLLEAAAMGLPAVATDIAGCRDAVVHQTTGCLVPPHDPTALAKAIQMYARDPELRRRHGQAGRERVLAHFHPESVWSAMEAEYRRALRQRPPAGVAARACQTQIVKRALEVALAVTGLLATAPLLAVAAAAIWLSMGRPVFFRQPRAGLNGRIFMLYKFRTMRSGRDPLGRLLPDADRLTACGRLLRRTSIDELPQLWNVLTGDMSLVGPRPLLAVYLTRYSDWERRRLEVKPGITGWAQVNGRNGLDWRRKFELDVWYVDHRNLWLDARILWRTVYQVFRCQGIQHAQQATMSEFMGTEHQAGAGEWHG